MCNMHEVESCVFGLYCVILHHLIVGTLSLCTNTQDLLLFLHLFYQCLAGIVNVAAHHMRF
jgi:hypothetical protein